mgnify:CR=1 FL=1
MQKMFFKILIILIIILFGVPFLWNFVSPYVAIGVVVLMAYLLIFKKI